MSRSSAEIASPTRSGESPRDWGAWLLPSLGSVIAILALWQAVGPVAHALFAGDGDVGRHIRVGTTILETGSIPRRDLFSHTMRGAPFVPYEWLSEVVFALAHRAGGLAGVAFLTGLLFSAAGWVVYLAAVRHGTTPVLAALAAGYSLLLQGIHLLPRPHLFTTLLAAVYLALLLAYRRGGRGRWLWPLPPLMVLWANLHGGFLVGLILLGMFAAEAAWERLERRTEGARRRFRALAAVTLACAAATLLNPAGPALLVHVTDYLRSAWLADRIREYGSPNFHRAEGQVLLVGLAGSLVLLLAARPRVTRIEGLLFLSWTAAALYAARNVPLWAVLVVPVVARWATEALRSAAAGPAAGLGRLARALEEHNRRLSAMDARFSKPLAPTALFLLIGGWVLLHPADPRYAFSAVEFPVEATREARRLDLEGNVFNEFHWGGYLLYAAPEIPVFIDGQVDFYGEALARDYYAIRNLEPGWRELLEEHDIAWTLTPPGTALNAVLRESPGWRLVHGDPVATIFVRER